MHWFSPRTKKTKEITVRNWKAFTESYWNYDWATELYVVEAADCVTKSKSCKDGYQGCKNGATCYDLAYSEEKMCNCKVDPKNGYNCGWYRVCHNKWQLATILH